MLAKTWKTILLAICIIAVLFNIISKIVRTPSFQKNLDKVIEENIVTVDSSQFSNTIENAGQLTDREIRMIREFIKDNYKEMYMKWSQKSDNGFYGE